MNSVYASKKDLLKVWRLAWPVILSNVSIPLLGIVDLAVVGNTHDSDQLAATALGTIFFDALLGLMIFLRMATTGLIAQSQTNVIILQRNLIFSLLISVTLLIFKPLLWQACYNLASSKAHLKPFLSVYFNIRYFAIPAVLANFVLIGYSFGRQNTQISLVVLTITNVLAISLDYVFIQCNGLGVKGLGFANLISQWLGLLVNILMIHKKFSPFKVQNPIKLFDVSGFKQLFHLNKDIFIRTVCLMASMLYFTYIGGTLGQNYVSANAILISFMMFISYSLDGFAIACEVLVGNALGKRNINKLKHTIKTSAICSIFLVVIMVILGTLFGENLINAMTDMSKINHLAQKYFPWLHLLAFLASASFLLDGVYIGATWSKPMRNTMLIATLLIFFPAVRLFQFMGNNGLWLSYTLFISARGLGLAIDLRTKLVEFKKPQIQR